jgi:Uma2 family endonuclease
MAGVALPATLPANDRIVLYNVSWETYVTLRKNLGDSPIRLTYDGSSLEIMSPSGWHEHAKKILGRMSWPRWFQHF